MSSFSEQCVPTRKRLSYEGRAVLIRSFDGCHSPSKEKKDAILREVQKTDPEYSMAKLASWFSHRRKESKKEQKDRREEVVRTLLDPTTSLACEMWPSFSADALLRLHTMLLEQEHMTVQHKEVLAMHFGVERKHLENFLNWRLACLNNEDNDIRGEDHHQARKHPPGTINDDDIMDVDKRPDPRPYLHTPASSTSPEPVYSMTPFIHEQLRCRPSVNTNLVASCGHVYGWPTSISDSQSRPQALRISSNAPPSEANSPMTAYLPSPTSPRMQLSPTKLIPVSPLSSPPSASTNVSPAVTSPITSDTRQEDEIRTHASVAPVGEPPQAPAPRTPRTLRDFEEAYAPTYARIERFLQDVECNKYAHVGLTPEMLQQVK